MSDDLRDDLPSTEPALDELLAAYADGALAGAERARLEALLETDADARAEVDSLRQVINATRAVQPRPTAEPAWDELAAAIRAACRDAAPAPTPGWIARLRALLRPRFAAPLVAVAAALVLFILWSGSRGEHSDRTAPVVALEPTPTSPAELPGTDLRASEVEDLDQAELDLLLASLGPDSIDDQPDLEPDDVLEPDPGTEPTEASLPDDLVTEWVLADVDAVAEPADTDLFSVPDFGTLLDDLSEAEIDELDAFLAAQTG